MDIRTETSRENIGQGIDDEAFGKNFDDIFGKAWYERDEHNAYMTYETDKDTKHARSILEKRIRKYYDGEIRFEFVDGWIRGWYFAPDGHFDKMDKVNK